MKRNFKAAVAALSFSVALIGAAAAGQFEDGSAALLRGDYPTAIKLLHPLAEQGDVRAQAALVGIPGASNYSGLGGPSPSLHPFPWGLFVAEAMTIASLLTVALARQLARARGVAARAKFLASLPPEVREKIEDAERIARQHPGALIAFGLESVEMADNGFRLRAAGVHRGRDFSFSIVFTMSRGPVALCEWLPNGPASDALLDILAAHADVSRADSRFDDMVETSAIILQAIPSNVPFAQITRLHSKVIFELAEDQPEIYLNFDFAAKTGTIVEKDPMYRKSLVNAFQGSKSQAGKAGGLSSVHPIGNA